MEPTQQTPAPQQPTTPVSNRMSKRTIVALWLLIGPTALLVGTFILYAIVNAIIGTTSTPATDGSLFSETPPIVSIMNIVLFLVGTVTVLTWLPGIIIGIVLLATKK